MRALCLLVLLSLAALAQERKPEVHLNHAFVVPDPETYQAIRNSDFVKQFAVWEERTTHRKDITYTGFYLYGRHTYFEFLKPDDPKSVGGSAIAFGVDRTGELDLLQERAEAAGMQTEVQTITRAFNGKDVDWFRSLKRKDEDKSSLGIWTLEYVPTFLNEWNPKPGEKSGLRREDVLRRYAEVVKQNAEHKMVVDADLIWVAVSTDHIAETVNECKVLGFKVNEKRSELSVARCSRKDLQITIVEAKAGCPAGLAGIGFTLRQKVDHEKLNMGSTQLILASNSAMWWFQSPTELVRCSREKK